MTIAVLFGDDIAADDAGAAQCAGVDLHGLGMPLLGQAGFDVAVGQNKVEQFGALEVAAQR